jgi:hypothetical protein
MGVAKELGYTLTRLLSEATEEEIILWSCYFGYLNDEQEKVMKKSKSRRR